MTKRVTNYFDRFERALDELRLVLVYGQERRGVKTRGDI